MNTDEYSFVSVCKYSGNNHVNGKRESKVQSECIAKQSRTGEGEHGCASGGNKDLGGGK